MAIELAAARSRSMSPDDLLARLGDRFRLLRGAGRGGDARHQTLRATVGWSYQLLLDEERIVFDRLSVFAGGFDVTAAEEVCADGAWRRTMFWICWCRWSTSPWSWRNGRRAGAGTGCSRRCASTARNDSSNAVRWDRPEIVTCADTSTWRRQPTSCGAAPASSMLMPIFDREWANIRAAHGWAVATEDLVAADALVAATAQHAFIRRNREHGEWAERTLSLGNADRHPHPTTYGWASHWAFHAGHVRPVRRARATRHQRCSGTGPSRHHLVLDVPGRCTRRVRTRQRSER